MDRRRIACSVGAAVVAAVVGLAACRPAQPTAIGFVGGLSDRVADLGVAGRNGAQLAIETLNAEGTARYALVVEDDRHEADHATAAVDALARRGVAFIVGPMTSAIAVAVAPEIERRALVTISPTANTDRLSGRDDHFFRVIADVGTGARQVAEHLHARNAGPLAVLMDLRNREFAEAFGRAAAARYRALGGHVVAEIDYRSDTDVDFAALARRLLDARPGVVLLAASAIDSALVAQHLRRSDPRLGLAVTPWASGNALVQLGGRALDGALLPTAHDPNSTARAFVAFRERYRARFGEDPSPPAISAFDAVMLGVRALERRRDGQTLRDVLARPDRWDGLQRGIALDAHGDSHDPIHLTELRDGRLVTLGQ